MERVTAVALVVDSDMVDSDMLWDSGVIMAALDTGNISVVDSDTVKVLDTVRNSMEDLGTRDLQPRSLVDAEEDSDMVDSDMVDSDMVDSDMVDSVMVVVSDMVLDLDMVVDSAMVDLDMVDSDMVDSNMVVNFTVNCKHNIYLSIILQQNIKV